ncbi:LysM domain-containing protein [Lachnospiraceae bacterium RM5]|nr:LysM domain-containing protein [Lachnospiraceae bacterium RM5]
MKKITMIKAVIFTLFIILLFTFIGFNSKTNASTTKQKYYTSIEIMPGDTLWSIANEYKPDDTISTNDYINDLKEINGITSDNITSGNYLTIYYLKK